MFLSYIDLNPLTRLVVADNTQNYNRYGYVLNNPLKYTDRTGELWGMGELLSAVVIGAVIAATTYTMTALLADVPFTAKGFIASTTIGALSSAVTFGIGSAFSNVCQFALKLTYSALAHAMTQGIVSGVQGGNFWTGFASGALSSIASSAWQGVGGNWGSSDFGTIAFGTVSGGAGATLTGGNFWQGAATGLTVSLLNHVAHAIDESFVKNKLDREVDVAYGANADSEASATDATLVKVKNSIPTLKRLYADTGNVKMYAQPDYDYAPSDGVSMAKTFAYDTDNYKTSTATYFKSSFKSYRILAKTMLHEFGHSVHFFNGDFLKYRQGHTKAQTDRWQERYAFNFAFKHGGVPYKNDTWYLMNKKE